MAKVMNTKWFVDRHSHHIDQLYEGRLGGRAEDLSVEDINTPAVLKALSELRLYRLPLYFKVPTIVKSRIQAQGALCGGLDDTRHAAALERELVEKFSCLFYVRRQHPRCNKCGTRRASLDGICYACRANNRDEARELSREYNRLASKAFGKEEGWYSPKTILMATEFGCAACGVRYNPGDWLWDGDLEGWSDGLCPNCQHLYPLGSEWSLPKNPRANAPVVSYSECVSCAKQDYDYAFWSMCEMCYTEWQDRYLEAEALYDLVDRWGALSALLVRSSPDWLAFLRSALENRYCWNMRTKKFPTDHVMVPFRPKGPKVRSLKDAGIKLGDLI